ncbi:hypothetical protein HELRODRAFT_162596 [Helobdella robusta]|uniref:Uncharacterized protein n=1 Tax=Helobdella robusta TaxID=6412 RepID=T1ESW4_HELRO|nr:hypothetical protein HELRODRAFT_162596 [Helobdella robusta]ESN99105.1 hypothetical protein HELRODRAFT_162596 [Helobdella robusta]
MWLPLFKSFNACRLSSRRDPLEDNKVDNHSNLNFGYYEDSPNRVAGEMKRFHTLNDFEECLKNMSDQPVLENECDTCCGDQLDSVIDDFTNNGAHSAVGKECDDYFVPPKKQKFSACSVRRFVLLGEFDINKTPMGYTDVSLDLPQQLNVLC